MFLLFMLEKSVVHIDCLLLFYGMDSNFVMFMSCFFDRNVSVGFATEVLGFKHI